jgi:N-acetylneuraminate synthase
MKINTKSIVITQNSPTYFIADIAANHDGEIERALKLIELAAKAETIVSKKGFDDLGASMAHQAKWEKSVVDVYKDAELPLSWTERLKAKCDEVGIDFFSAIYDENYLEVLKNDLPFFKIGSGDITWAQMLEKTAIIGKPVFIATGASTLEDVKAAMSILQKHKTEICLMQCNTNYTGNDNNHSFANLRVISEYRKLYPDVILGLSDHTSTPTTTLGAVALGATVIEKHFTDDRTRKGPDHAFSLDSNLWAEMVLKVRELESTLGDGIKRVEGNEEESQVVQRRAARVNKNIAAGQQIIESDIIFLRPCPKNAATPLDVWGRGPIFARKALSTGDFIPFAWLKE